MLNRLHILKNYQNQINNADMFYIHVTTDEKRIFKLDPMNLKTDMVIWFYKNLQLNRRDYLDILANRIGIPHNNKQTKYDLVDMITKCVIFD